MSHCFLAVRTSHCFFSSFYSLVVIELDGSFSSPKYFLCESALLPTDPLSRSVYERRCYRQFSYPLASFKHFCFALSARLGDHQSQYAQMYFPVHCIHVMSIDFYDWRKENFKYYNHYCIQLIKTTGNPYLVRCLPLPSLNRIRNFEKFEAL